MEFPFDVTLPLTEQEILDGLQRARLRRASKGRLIVQTAVLLLVCAWCLIAFFGNGAALTRENGTSLFLAVASLVLIALMWLLPAWQLRRTAKETVEAGEWVHLWVFADGVAFGNSRPEKAMFPFGGFFCDDGDESLVFRFPIGDVVIVPARLLTPAQWAWLRNAVKG